MAEPRPDDPYPDWIDRAAKVAAALGLNQVRVRWKLQRRVNQWRAWRRRSEVRLDAVRYDHRVCGQCTAVNDRDATVCHRCESRLAARPLELARRVGLGAPLALPASTWLAIAIVAVYARTAMVGGDPGDIAPSILYTFGANLSADAMAGEPWRYATSLFLHGDLLHVAFNVLALVRVGALVEDLFSGGALLACFLVTGIAASLGSVHLGLEWMSVGASGAVCGLIGAAGAAGQRSGSSRGREIRDSMLRWALITAIFSVAVANVDYRAHGVGFAAGVVLGLVIRPRWFAAGHRRGRRTSRLVGAISGALLAATIVAAAVPLPGVPIASAIEQGQASAAAAAAGLDLEDLGLQLIEAEVETDDGTQQYRRQP
jgi:membrane associated rhomboid family serine protease